MHGFGYQDSELYCEQVPISKVAEDVGTPFYLYSHATLVSHFESYRTALSSIPHVVAYAVKANDSLAILKLFSQHGSGADIVSGGELHRALAAGISPERIVFAGVGKTADEIQYAIEQNVLMFNVESPPGVRGH